MGSKENGKISNDKMERQASYTSQRFVKNNISNGNSKLSQFNSIVEIWTDLLSRRNVPYQNLKAIVRDLELPASILENISNRTEDSEEIISKKIFEHLTLRIDKLNVWDHFYTFPELYEQHEARVLDDLVTNEDGVLTREVVAACLSCLHKSPLTGVYTYIKLDLASKRLVDIDVLQHYIHLVYLDLSSNCLTEVGVLSRLPYLQHLAVHSNRLPAVLDYDTPQWLLTEVYHGHNEVTEIRDLSLFWSITVLDLSYNHIEYINGLDKLQFLRRLDLSHNKIRRLENLSNTKLLWLDLSYNDISSFECDERRGLHTLRQLEYLNVDGNEIGTLKVFSGCTRLRELHACSNSLGALFEVPLCLRQLGGLVSLDLRRNPLCEHTRYRDVVVNTLPRVYRLDGAVLDPVETRTSKMDMRPDVSAVAGRRLLRLLYIQQLSRARVSPHVPPAGSADTTLVVLVGPEATGKGALARRMAERHSNIELAKQHTTSYIHSVDHYKLITRKNFDNMLLAGEFLTCSAVTDGTCGLSREEAFTGNSKVKIVIMDIVGALMLRLRGYKPYVILASCSDKEALKMRQEDRKRCGLDLLAKRAMYLRLDLLTYIYSHRPTEEATTLQVLISDRIIIDGILQEIIRVAIDDDDESPSLLSLYSTDSRVAAAPCCACDRACKCCHCRLGDKGYNRPSILQDESYSSSVPTGSLEESTEYDEWIRSQWATPESFVPSVEDDYDYESIHRNCPGMFWDTIVMEDHDAAYKKLKMIIKNIVHEQKKLKLFNINFSIENNIIFNKKLEKISLQLASK